MSDKLINNSPDFFRYRDPLGKGVYLSVLLGFLFLAGSLIYILFGFFFSHNSTAIKIGLIIAAIAFIVMVALPIRGAKQMMDLRAEFTKWSVSNYGLTPLEFLVNKNIAEGAQGRIMLTDVSTSTQKFLNSEVETVEIEVTEDRTEFKEGFNKAPHVIVSIKAPKVQPIPQEPEV